MKKKIRVIIAAILCLILSVCFAACNNNGGEDSDTGHGADSTLTDGDGSGAPSGGEEEKHKHTLQYVAAENSTCNEDGSIAYWHCSDCGKNYDSEQAANELGNITVFATGLHNYKNNICEDCGAHKPSKGLEYQRNGIGWTVSIGTCTDINIVIPAIYEGLPVTSVAEEAFCENDSLKSVEIPNRVTSIERMAFYNCRSLKSVDIPNSVVNIGEYAFGGCNGLTGVKIGSGITKIGDFAFWSCRILESIKITGNAETIGQEAFYECMSLENIEIPDSVTSIGDSAFALCDKLKYNEYDNALYLGNKTNPYVVLMQVINEDITSCTINENAKIIYDHAFAYCRSLESIIIPNGIIGIGKNAFSNCGSLKIYCEASSKPNGWNSAWNPSDRPVEWGYSN